MNLIHMAFTKLDKSNDKKVNFQFNKLVFVIFLIFFKIKLDYRGRLERCL